MDEENYSYGSNIHDDDGTEPRGTEDDFDRLEAEIIRESARRMGSIKTAKKALSSAENGKRGGRPLTAVCNCHQTPHKYNCPVAIREYQRAHRSKVKA